MKFDERNIVIPNDIKELPADSLMGNSELISITLPDGLTTIGKRCFSRCENLETVSMPDSVRQIGEYAFSDCSALKEIHIPSSLSEIEQFTFKNCSSLEEIDIPSNVRKISLGAFMDCKGLKKVTIPMDVIDIPVVFGRHPFSGCDDLTIYTPEESSAEAFAINCKIPYVNIVEEPAQAEAEPDNSEAEVSAISVSEEEAAESTDKDFVPDQTSEASYEAEEKSEEAIEAIEAAEEVKEPVKEEAAPVEEPEKEFRDIPKKEKKRFFWMRSAKAPEPEVIVPTPELEAIVPEPEEVTEPEVESPAPEPEDIPEPEVDEVEAPAPEPEEIPESEANEEEVPASEPEEIAEPEVDEEEAPAPKPEEVPEPEEDEAETPAPEPEEIPEPEAEAAPFIDTESGDETQKPRKKTGLKIFVVIIILAAIAAAVFFKSEAGKVLITRIIPSEESDAVTLEEFIDYNPEAKEQIVKSVEGTDVSVGISGNTLVYVYDLSATEGMTQETAESDEIKAALEETLDASGSRFGELCSSLETDTGVSGITVEVRYQYGDEILLARKYTSADKE